MINKKSITERKKKIISWLLLPSFEVSLGSIAGLYFASVALQLKISIFYYFGLFSITAFFYAYDHLRDNVKLITNKIVISKNNRRFLSKQQKKILWAYAFINLAITLFFAWRLLPTMHHKTTLALVLIGLLVIAHLLLARMPNYFAKEFNIALLYTLGIWTVPVSISMINAQHENIINYFYFFPHFFAVMANLLLFSWLDYADDQRSGFPGLAHWIKKSQIRYLTFAASILGLICLHALTVHSLLTGPTRTNTFHIYALWTFSIILLFPSIVAIAPEYLRKTAKRFFADAVFLLLLIPAIMAK